MRPWRAWIYGACSGSSVPKRVRRGATDGLRRWPPSCSASRCASARSRTSRTPGAATSACSSARRKARRCSACVGRSRLLSRVLIPCRSPGNSSSVTWRSSRCGRGSITWTGTSAPTTVFTRRRRDGTPSAAWPSRATRTCTSTTREEEQRASSRVVDVHVRDSRGRALFFFSQPLNDSLARAIPGAVEEIRRVQGNEPFTLVFDRGGYSGETFRFLQAEGIGFITYLKGRSARRRYAAKGFQAGWFALEGRRHSYKLFEKKTRLRGVGLIRTILFVGEDQQQIPVLTNLAPTAKAAK